MFYFLDDTDFPLRKSTASDIFIRGGFIISESGLSKAENLLNQVKEKYSIPNHLPLKWNLKDSTVNKSYSATLGKKRYSEIIQQADSIRLDIFKGLQKLDLEIIVSIRQMYGTATREKIIRWAFTDLLQRFGLEVKKKDEKINLLVLDWESERSKNRDIFCDVYYEAYTDGKGYHSGALKNISYPFIGFSVTHYNPLLQLSDLMVGCFGEFFKTIMRGGQPRPALIQLYHLLETKVAKSYNNQIFGFGFVIAPKRLLEFAVECLNEVDWKLAARD